MRSSIKEARILNLTGILSWSVPKELVWIFRAALLKLHVMQRDPLQDEIETVC
jgi:hypothetical protein